MEHTQFDEFEILGNVIIALTIQQGGEMEVSRDLWENITEYMVLREFDEKRNVDVFRIVGGSKGEAL
jgi:hypothetical protein